MVGADGQLRGQRDGRRAVAAIVRVAGDLRPGECPGLPDLADPCPQDPDLDPGTRTRLAARAVRRLLAGLGGGDATVTARAGAAGETGRVAVRRSGWAAPAVFRVVARDPGRFRLEFVEEPT